LNSDGSAWLQGAKADIVGLQEVRALPEEVPAEVLGLPRRHFAFSPAERQGYSGVAIASRIVPEHPGRSNDSIDSSIR